MSLLCVGSVAYDVIELPDRDPVAVLGGSATWFSAAATLYTKPGLVAVVGDDFRDEDRAFLGRRGVDLSGLQRRPGATFRWHGRYHTDMKGRDSLATELGVFADFEPVLPEAARDPDILFLGNIHPALQKRVLDQAPGARFVGMDTIEIWIRTAREALLSLLPRVDLLFLNDEEVIEITGERTLLAAGRKILDLGARGLVVKRGEHGAILFLPEGLSLYPAFPVASVVDPTGAGDSFAGGALGYLDRIAERGPAAIRQAMAVGTVTASFCIEGFGPGHFESVSMEALRKRLDEYCRMTDFGGRQASDRLNGL